MAEQKKEEFLDEIEDSDLDQDELIDIDAEAAELEKLDISKDAIAVIARNSEGSIRDSLTILDQCILSFNNENINVESVNQTMGLTSQSFLLDLYINIVNGDIINANKVMHNIYKNGSCRSGQKLIFISDINISYSSCIY